MVAKTTRKFCSFSLRVLSTVFTSRNIWLKVVWEYLEHSQDKFGSEIHGNCCMNESGIEKWAQQHGGARFES